MRRAICFSLLVTSMALAGTRLAAAEPDPAAQRPQYGVLYTA